MRPSAILTDLVTPRSKAETPRSKAETPRSKAETPRSKAEPASSRTEPACQEVEEECFSECSTDADEESDSLPEYPSSEAKSAPLSPLSPRSSRVPSGRRSEASTPFSMGYNSMRRDEKDLEMRVFILDNSGSTRKHDGRVLITEENKVRFVETDRWCEVISIALSHAEFNARKGVRSQFVLLNPQSAHKPVEGRDYIIVDPSLGQVGKQVDAVGKVLRENGPCGNTPLTSRLRQLRERIQQEGKCKRLALTIVTDGLPTSTDSTNSTPQNKEAFVKEIRTWANTFQCTPVIRLTTNQGNALKYYKRIEEEAVGFDIDVLDDFHGEAKLANARGNGWIAYSPMVHRIREGGGVRFTPMGHLTQRTLSYREMGEVLDFLLRKPNDPPLPEEPEELLQAVKHALPNAPLVYNSRKKRMSPPVDLKKLKVALGFSLRSRVLAVITRKMPKAKTWSPCAGMGTMD